MIEVKNLSVFFGERKILNDIHVNFETGKIHAIFGLNGAGKTTFFNSLYGFVKSSGIILYNNEKIKKQTIGFLETESFFYSYLTGKEYLSIFQPSNNALIFDIDKLANLLNLPLQSFVDTYSIGMKKKIALLGILKLNKNIYLFDEPFNSLDIETVLFLKSIIKQLRDKGVTIFISSHIIETLLDIADDFYMLESGSIIKFDDSTQFQSYCNTIAQRINIQVQNTILS